MPTDSGKYRNYSPRVSNNDFERGSIFSNPKTFSAWLRVVRSFQRPYCHVKTRFHHVFHTLYLALLPKSLGKEHLCPFNSPTREIGH